MADDETQALMQSQPGGPLDGAPPTAPAARSNGGPAAPPSNGAAPTEIAFSSPPAGPTPVQAPAPPPAASEGGGEQLITGEVPPPSADDEQLAKTLGVPVEEAARARAQARRLAFSKSWNVEELREHITAVDGEANDAALGVGPDTRVTSSSDMTTDESREGEELHSPEEMVRTLAALAREYHRYLVSSGQTEQAKSVLVQLEALGQAEGLEAPSGAIKVKGEVKGVPLKSRTKAGRKQAVATVVQELLADGFLQFMETLSKGIPQQPSQIVKLRDVTYRVKAPMGSLEYETVGSKCAPCLHKRPVGGSSGKGSLVELTVATELTAYLMPGSMTLVMGPPKCGKTTVHKAVAGRLMVNKKQVVSGSVTYNERDRDSVNYRRLCTFVAQTDQHLPTLTVRETCEFAATCTHAYTTEPRPELLQLLQTAGVKIPDNNRIKGRGVVAFSTEVILRILGLQNAADTIVGSTTLRGVSGGERHRVTLAEMMSSPSTVYCLDEISTGLDSQATYDIVSTIRIIARMQKATVLMSLLQPSPETFRLFDRLIILDKGCIIYQGPREDAVPYFTSLGYEKPPMVDELDFLQEIPTNLGRDYLRPGGTHLTTQEFVSRYQASRFFADVVRVVDSPMTHEIYLKGRRPLGVSVAPAAEAPSGAVVTAVAQDGSYVKPHMDSSGQAVTGDRVTAVSNSEGGIEFLSNAGPGTRGAGLDAGQLLNQAAEPVRMHVERPFQEVEGYNKEQFEREFILSPTQSMAAVFKREFTVAWRNWSFTAARLMQSLVLGLLAGTLFYDMPDAPTTTNMDLRRSLLFTAQMALSMGAMAQIPGLIDARGVFYKQHNARFFRIIDFVLAKSIVNIPWTIVEVALYSCLVYFLPRFALYPGSFFIFYLVLFGITFLMANIVRFLAVAFPGPEAAAGFSIIIIVTLLLFNGFLITPNQIPGWFIWIYWISPFQYGYSSLMLNEFLSPKWDEPCSSVNQTTSSFCDGEPASTSVGVAFLELYGVNGSYARLWLGVLFIYGCTLLFMVFTFIAATFIHYDETSMIKPEGQERGSQSEKDGMARTPPLAFVPITMSWINLTYEVDIPGQKEPRMLLNYITGYAQPGTMTALMGSSGAGKTTLMDVLAGKKTIGRTGGRILLNGHDKEDATFARIIGYVEQMDLHMPYATVREALVTSANLRMSRSISKEHRACHVDEVMDMLELWSISDQLIGFKQSGGLTVEEAKRVTIAVEMVANPSILFLDEPTSGLDSRAARIVLRCMKNIANSGRTVLCTIHQPSLALFSQFDALLLLKKGGQTVFFGPLGERSSKMIGYFEAIPGTSKCGDKNPADYMLQVIGAGVGGTAKRDYAYEYSKSALSAANEKELGLMVENKGQELVERGSAASTLEQMKEIFIRTQRTYWRNVRYSYGRFAFSVILGALLGLTYFNINVDSQSGLASASGFIYIAIVFMGSINAQNIVPQLLAERAVYYREQSSKMYSPFAYSFSIGATEVPYLIGSTLIFAGITSGLTQLNIESASDFFFFWWMMFLFTAMAMSFGNLLSFLAPDAGTATVLVPITINIWNLTCGFMIGVTEMPVFWKWLYYVNPTQYTINGVFASTFYCDTTSSECAVPNCTTTPEDCPSCSCPRLSDLNNIFVWTAVSSRYDISHSDRIRNMFVMLAFVIGFRVCSYLALQFVSHNKR